MGSLAKWEPSSLLPPPAVPPSCVLWPLWALIPTLMEVGSGGLAVDSPAQVLLESHLQGPFVGWPWAHVTWAVLVATS